MIDLYCERTGPGLWGEPLNLITSAAYLVAAWALVRRLRGGGVTPIDRALAWLPVCIAIGSVFFHAFASAWSRRLDEAPIVIFQLLFLWTYGRRLVGLSSRAVAAVLIAFLVAVAGGRAAGGALNGSLAYVPALLAAGAVGIWHARFHPQARFLPLAGACVFAIAVLFRVIDNDVCGTFPSGTHFLWHLLTAVVVYVFGRTVIEMAPAFRPAQSY